MDKKGSVKCIKTVLINAPKEFVWDVLVDINSWAEWEYDIKKAYKTEKIQKNSTIFWKADNIEFKAKIFSFELYKKISWSYRISGLHIIHSWYLQETEGITQVTSCQQVDGIMARIFRKSVTSSIEYDNKRWVEFLKMECEKQKNKYYTSKKLFFEIIKN